MSAEQVGLKYGFRSGLEEKIAEDLSRKGIPFTYESLVIPYTVPAKVHKYHPDWVLQANGIIVESKGRFMPEDRAKQLLVKKQYPDLDIRLVFSSSRAKINKRSTTTYADWCIKNGIPFADKAVPDAWLKEPPNLASLRAIAKLMGE